MLSGGKRKQSNPNEYYTSGQIASILQSCDIKVGGEIDTHFLLFCPFHYNVHTPACEIDKNNGMFICFSCGESGSIVDMVMRITNRNYFEASRLIHSKRDDVDIERVVQETIDTSLDHPEFDMDTIQRLHQNLLQDSRAKEYFYSRNITDESFVNFKLGYSDKQDMVIVPVFDEFSRCLGFVGRSVEGKAFKNSVGLPKSKVLFNLNKVKRSSIIVVESSFDVIRLSQAGFSAVATLGATVSRTQIHLLQQYAKNIVVCPDSDAAGKKMVDRIVGGVKNKAIDVVSLKGAKDVGDLSDQEMKDLFNKYSGNTLILAV
jgi:DNA primase